MTAKQLLHDFVDRLSEDDAAITAAMLIPSASRSLRDDERAAIERGLAEADAGELISLEDVVISADPQAHAVARSAKRLRG